MLWGIDGSLVIGPRPEPPDFSKVFCDLQTGCFGLIGLGEPLLIPALIGLSGAVREEEVEIGGNRLLLFKVTCDLSSLASHMVGREGEVASCTVGGLASCAVGREEGIALHTVGREEGVGLHMMGKAEGVAAVGVGVLDKDIHIITRGQ